MSMQGVENTEDALISMIKSIKKEMKDDIMKKQFEASTASISNETSSIASNEVDKDDNHTSTTAFCLLPKELSPGRFLLPFYIDDHSLYAITTLEAKDNIMPLDVYKYLGLDKFKDAGTVEKTTGTNEPLGTIYILDEIAEPISFLPDRRGLVKRWDVCKPIHVTYDDENGKDYGMWPTCDPDSKFYFGYNEVFGVRYGQQKIDDTTRERRYYKWVAQNYEFSKHHTLTSTTLNDHFPYDTNNPIPIPQEHLEQEENKQLPIRPCLCNYSFEQWLKIRIGHNKLHESDHEFIFNEWILDSYDVEEEYAREIGDPYSRRFDEYNRVFKNEIEHLSNEYILRIGKKGHVLDDVWGKCQQNHKKTNKAWHDKAYEEDEMWHIGDEKTDYDPPYVNIETFEVKKYSFKGGRSFICITDRENEALPLGRVNGAQFKAMIRKELEGHIIQKLGGNYRDRFDPYSFGNLAEFATVMA
ncbi:hypothetical protein Tco_1056272 [Tanacetum coccineum]|uniref:C2H2-type domain-containing protein n=1 Tax=Tanacetum coccineum TaxID=301880 RepID=A0ABQ5H3H1_9ASTR